MKNDDKGKLTAPQMTAALMVASGHTTRQIAQKIGVAKITVTRWRAMATFQAEVSRRQTQLLTGLFAHLLRASKKAIRRLESVIDKGSEQNQVSAANTVLRHLLAMHDASITEQRLAKLEEQISATQQTS